MYVMMFIVKNTDVAECYSYVVMLDERSLKSHWKSRLHYLKYNEVAITSYFL